jgi:hypothetical protein
VRCCLSASNNIRPLRHFFHCCTLTVFTVLLPGNALIKSVTIYIYIYILGEREFLVIFRRNGKEFSAQNLDLGLRPPSCLLAWGAVSIIYCKGLGCSPRLLVICSWKQEVRTVPVSFKSDLVVSMHSFRQCRFSLLRSYIKVVKDNLKLPHRHWTSLSIFIQFSLHCTFLIFVLSLIEIQLMCSLW